MRFLTLAPVLAFVGPIVGQQIYDIVRSPSLRCAIVAELATDQPGTQWQTTWDRSKLLTYQNLSPNPINFVSPGAIGQADIVVRDTSVFQTVYGFGASLSACASSWSRAERAALLYAASFAAVLRHLLVRTPF